jgi:SNF2 family DNA or RNA helicase
MEVGTGKSKVLLDTACELKVGALIVAAPKSLSGTWKEQAALHCFRNYSFIAWDAIKSSTIKWRNLFDMAMQSDMIVFFVNTEAFQIHNALLSTFLDKVLGRPTMLVVDESSDIKNPAAARTKELIKLGTQCTYRMISTGTEITNSVLDLYSQFEFLSPGFWGFKSFFFFKNYFAILEEHYLSGGRTFKEIVGFRKIDELQSKISPHVSRALKSECLDLPDKIHAIMPVSLEGPSAKIYNELKKSLIAMLDNGEVLTVANKAVLFMKFRQLVGGTLSGVGIIDDANSKIKALYNELSDSSEQAIIWSCFTEETNLIQTRLAEFGIVRFDGQTSQNERTRAITSFVSGAARLIVANPAAAAQGLNLQNAHIEYWYSLPTSAKTYEQAEGRIHRSGQKDVCVYKSIQATNTVDDRVSEILRNKSDMMLSFREGTVADLIELF